MASLWYKQKPSTKNACQWKNALAYSASDFLTIQSYKYIYKFWSERHRWRSRRVCGSHYSGPALCFRSSPGVSPIKLFCHWRRRKISWSVSPWQSFSTWSARPELTQMQLLTMSHSKGRDMALPVNIRLYLNTCHGQVFFEQLLIFAGKARAYPSVMPQSKGNLMVLTSQYYIFFLATKMFARKARACPSGAPCSVYL